MDAVLSSSQIAVRQLSPGENREARKILAQSLAFLSGAAVPDKGRQARRVFALVRGLFGR